jgi:peptide/nickel transport system permease protein
MRIMMRVSVFLLKRAGQLILLSLLVAFVTFCLSSIIPGDFFSTHLLDSSVRVETVEQLRHKYGLDQPAHIQYLRWLKNLVRLDFGNSMFYQRPVLPIVADALAKTLWMGIPALILGFGLGIMLGAVHGISGQRLTGRILDFVSAITLSLPSLLLGLAALLFAAHTHWFPLGSMTSLAGPESGLWSSAMDRIHHLILPVLCLTIPIFAYVERIQYSATRNSQDELYVRFARSRGLSGLRIFFQYVLRPGLNPVVSIAGPMFGGILSGSLVLEVIFAWPGLGQITYDALFNSDLFLLAGCIMGSSLLLVVGNMLADCVLIAIDPRTRSSAGKGLG